MNRYEALNEDDEMEEPVEMKGVCKAWLTREGGSGEFAIMMVDEEEEGKIEGILIVVGADVEEMLNKIEKAFEVLGGQTALSPEQAFEILKQHGYPKV